jgi:substrate import-associated zinc metallohydrolase lipoprotein
MKFVMKKYIYSLMLTAGLAAGFVSCSEDEIEGTIFDTTEEVLDPNSFTYALDKFAEENFLVPYNMRFLYRIEDIETDMTYNLVPATYEKSIEMAALMKYLWLDVYKENVPDKAFLAKYAPKMLQLLGSPAYNPTSGTETVGLAESGVKISLYKVNELDVNNIEDLNEDYFKTMHHEFSHILHQTKVYPESFQEISTGNYDGFGWQDRADVEARTLGFVTPYGSSGVSEDWVETIANYIVKNDTEWNKILEDAKYDYERETVKIEDFNISDPSIAWYEPVYAGDGTIIEYEVVYYSVSRDEDGNVIWETDPETGEQTLIYIENDDVDGPAVIQQKLDMCRTWLKESFSIDLEVIRQAVQERQYLMKDGEYVFDEDGNYINLLTRKLDGKDITLMDSLVNDIKNLQQEASQE